MEWTEVWVFIPNNAQIPHMVPETTHYIDYISMLCHLMSTASKNTQCQSTVWTLCYWVMGSVNDFHKKSVTWVGVHFHILKSMSPNIYLLKHTPPSEYNMTQWHLFTFPRALCGQSEGCRTCHNTHTKFMSHMNRSNYLTPVQI